MRVTIELDIPDGQRIPTEHEIRMLTSPDWHADWWHISDVQDASGNEDLTEEEAREVLRLMDKYADCNVGINWDSIDVWADLVRDQRKTYAFLCEGGDRPYGIELSNDEDGNEILETYWFLTEENRQNAIKDNPDWVFPREEV